MDKIHHKCQECGEELKMSQFARIKREGEPAVKAEEHLVCRNYPKCSKAEKDCE